MVLPPPETVRARGKTLEKTLAKLLRLGLIAECNARAPDQAWRQEEDHAIALRITAAGEGVLGLAANKSEEIAGAQGSNIPTDNPPRPRGKLETVLSAIEADSGATLEELVAATSWQPHTTRAAITRLRQRGFDIRLADHDGRRAYRLAA
jgi:hypothetical protein